LENQEPVETSYLNNLIKKYLELVNSYYPNIRFSSSSSGGEDARCCYLELGFNADCIKGTSLEVKEKTNLIHYTSSVKNIIEILNGGFLRLNNLLNVNDPQEINFIIKKANIKNFEPYIEELKSTLFSASFCEVIDNDQPDTFAMWRLYGNDGSGCGIVFEIENYGYDWQNYILSQVQYGDSQSFNKFNELIQCHYKFQEEYDFPILNIPVTLTALTALYKNLGV
jgi:GTPase SAR1 family protein